MSLGAAYLVLDYSVIFVTIIVMCPFTTIILVLVTLKKCLNQQLYINDTKLHLFIHKSEVGCFLRCNAIDRKKYFQCYKACAVLTAQLLCSSLFSFSITHFDISSIIHTMIDEKLCDARSIVLVVGLVIYWQMTADNS